MKKVTSVPSGKVHSKGVPNPPLETKLANVNVFAGEPEPAEMFKVPPVITPVVTFMVTVLPAVKTAPFAKVPVMVKVVIVSACAWDAPMSPMIRSRKIPPILNLVKLIFKFLQVGSHENGSHAQSAPLN